MRILFIHPNYHSGGAEIAGTWPPAWVAYLAGSLRAAGFSDIHFVDAMTENVTQDDLRQRMIDLAPDVVGTTAITPAIYVAEEVLKLAAEVVPGALRVLGGIHATFMYRQVLSEAPWVDVIVRGVKAGLPLGDCIRIVATEAQEPVRTEFRPPDRDQAARYRHRSGHADVFASW